MDAASAVDEVQRIGFRPCQESGAFAIERAPTLARVLRAEQTALARGDEAVRVAGCDRDVEQGRRGCTSRPALAAVIGDQELAVSGIDPVDALARGAKHMEVRLSEQ